VKCFVSSVICAFRDGTKRRRKCTPLMNTKQFFLSFYYIYEGYYEGYNYMCKYGNKQQKSND
jgi:hypothetical protein